MNSGGRGMPPHEVRSGLFGGSIYRVLLGSRRFSVPKPLSQIQRSTFLPFQEASRTPSFGGLGLIHHWP